MLQLNNMTPYEADCAILLDLDGSEIWVIAVKATFEIKNAQPVVAETQEPVHLVDQYHGDPTASSLKYEGELVFKKPGTDVVINGHAYAPKGQAVSKLDVSIKIAGRQKMIRVYGDRQWKRSAFGLSMTAPKPFLKIPLIYERAFGGTATSSDSPKNHGAEYRNPIGVGFAMSKTSLSGSPLPNLEDPANEITRWNSRPNPVGVGFRCKHWEPRRRYVGTCDQAYVENRLPLYPLDFDVRYFLGASPDLVFTPHLRGGEPIELHHLTPEGYAAFTLPQVVLGFRTLIDHRWVDHQAKLGLVLIEPDMLRFTMTWHTYIPCHRRVFELEETQIFEKQVMEWHGVR